MGRKRKYYDDAERNRAHRAKKKAELEALKATVQVPAPDKAAMREQIIAEYEAGQKAKWAAELQAERIAAERKAGREAAKKADKSHEQGRVIGICDAAVYFIGKDRADISQTLLSHFMIDRETAEAALEADKRTKSLTLESLDKAGVWDKAPKVIRWN
jgi:hypothetical protein